MNNSKPEHFPDFFLIGAPRCGTTALSRYLTRNPQICFSRPKEPHYFTQLDHTPDLSELKHNYLDRCFAHSTPTHRALGEGSVSYLYMPGVIERILHFNPDARFIVLVRNPLTMLPSYHLRMQYLLQEDQDDFAKAWALQPARAKGEGIPKYCLDARLLQYSDNAKFGAQIERLYGIAGRERTKVIVFDDLAGNTLGVYQQVLEFLNIDDDGQTDFERRFESVTYRYRWLQQLMFIPATRGGKVVDTLQRSARKYNADGSKRKSMSKRMTNLNKVKRSPNPLTAQMADTLRDALRADNRLLSELLNRDLAYWLET